MDKEVGIIGLGIMGMPMARNLIKAGFKVTAYNRTASKVERIVAEGAVKADSPKELAAKNPVIITMVSDTPDVESVILGENGVIEGIKPDSVVIDMSTISPQATRKIAARLREKKAHMLDAPVSGGEGEQSPVHYQLWWVVMPPSWNAAVRYWQPWERQLPTSAPTAWDRQLS